MAKRHKIFFLILIFLSIALSIIETVGISAIMPFITVASNPAVLDEGYYKIAYDFFRFTDKYSFIITFGAAIIMFYIFRSIYHVFYTYFLNKYAFGIFKYISLKIFKIFCTIPYKDFLQKNSGDMIHLLNVETTRVGRLLLSFLHIFSELFTIITLYSLLIIVNWKMSLVLTAILAIIVFIVLKFMVKIVNKQGVKTSEAGMKQYRILHEAFYNFKFVKLRGNENNFFNNYETSAKVVARASVISETLGVLPRNFLESFGFSLLIGIVVFITWRTRTPEMIIPIISMYALALYRMLPAITRLLRYVNDISFNNNALVSVNKAINQEIEKEGDIEIDFEKSIRIDSINFKYNTGNDVIKNAGMVIKKGESIAITGESGSGKSTLVDLLIGIHKPNYGSLYIDDEKITNENIRSWRKKIGYIPQSIYLFDGTVADNVTFSAEYDEERLIKSLKMANIWDFLKKSNGLETLVGEGGIQLSGGQKQRIGIARALYTNPDVLVLDEATSSLDNDTEGKIMDEIYKISENKTLIVIAHRLSTVDRCKRRIVIENGSVLE
ncbi:MAG: ATP-binding cassette domain-containing protein [Treponema sp.]|nr:ATP-binding cassette domain-containing protein [Treponema sp.]